MKSNTTICMTGSAQDCVLVLFDFWQLRNSGGGHEIKVIADTLYLFSQTESLAIGMLLRRCYWGV